MKTDRLVGLNLLARPDFCENSVFFILPARRDEAANGLADHFAGAVAESFVAAGFQLVTVPSSVSLMIASKDELTIAANRPAARKSLAHHRSRRLPALQDISSTASAGT